ncbi:MAG: hypothetical protein PHP46_06790 [Candidatus Omnitrophica bacterium]|nr:hypothetical protein [Candidatus Omnitrophota bacterium]
MLEKIRRLVIFLLIYGLILAIGFKSGMSYNRMKNRLAVERIQILETVEPKKYFIVEKYNYGNYSQVNFREENEKDVTMKFFFNESLRPLLKLRDIEIYTSKGERIY